MESHRKQNDWVQKHKGGSGHIAIINLQMGLELKHSRILTAQAKELT
jgi:hypothetical protein